MQKIIHIDMDCFYAAIEIRDNPSLANRPVAVGGNSQQRGVLCTCNYIARRYGIHSAMPTATAYRLCPELLVLPVNMAKYRTVSKSIQSIFYEFTNLVEPLALDEAYLDVTDAEAFKGSATLIAEAIRNKIWEKEQLTASAGVAPNKFLAKIASSWNKPNGMLVITPPQVANFVSTLPVTKLFGVGKVTAKRLEELKIATCNDLCQYSLAELTHRFGKLGLALYNQSRGIDKRKVEPNRPRKSLSVEETFSKDLNNLAEIEPVLEQLHRRLLKRLSEAQTKASIKSIFAKIKFADFQQTTAEIIGDELHLPKFKNLFLTCYQRYQRPLRLIGIGVSFSQPNQVVNLQQTLF